MSIKGGIASLGTVLLVGSILSGCHSQLKPLPVNATAAVTVTNPPDDAFFDAVSSSDESVTPEKVQAYAQQRITQYLKLAGLEADVKATLYFTIGMAGELLPLKDPPKDPQGGLAQVGGSAEMPAPYIGAEFVALQQGKEILATNFSGGIFQTSKNWKGVQSVIDLSVGHLLKAFAKNGRQADRIVRILTSAPLLPRDPYTHVELNFGAIRLHQQGNLWEALGEIGAPARKTLEEAAKDKDPEIADEAGTALKKMM
jgi:hypothetical protein